MGRLPGVARQDFSSRVHLRGGAANETLVGKQIIIVNNLQEAVLRGHVKDIRGARRDLLILANDVSHIWAAMEALVADTPPETH